MERLPLVPFQKLVVWLGAAPPARMDDDDPVRTRKLLAVPLYFVWQSRPFRDLAAVKHWIEMLFVQVVNNDLVPVLDQCPGTRRGDGVVETGAVWVGHNQKDFHCSLQDSVFTEGAAGTANARAQRDSNRPGVARR